MIYMWRVFWLIKIQAKVYVDCRFELNQTFSNIKFHLVVYLIKFTKN